MTIHELLALTGLTGSDEIPVWDEEASGEPTKKITAQNFAAAIKTLASLLGTGDVVNDLTSTATDKPGSANMLKTLNDAITPSDVSLTISSDNTMTYVCKKASNIIYLAIDVTERSGSVTFVLPSGARPGTNIYVPMINSSGVTNGYLYLRSNGNCTASIVGTATVTYIPNA